MSPPRGYKTDFDSYQALISSPDEKVTIALLAEPRPSGKLPVSIVKNYMDRFREILHDFNEGKLEDIVIASAEGSSQDYAGTVEEEPLHGRVAVVHPEGSKILTILVQAVGEQRWEREGELVYAAIIEKVSFFKLKAADKCPIAKNPDYGYTTELPIKIGGGTSEGPYREEYFLNGLLGPHGEIVSYYRTGTVEKDGIILDEYVVVYGNNNARTIYMDIYNYDSPQIPFPLACSTYPPGLN